MPVYSGTLEGGTLYKDNGEEQEFPPTEAEVRITDLQEQELEKATGAACVVGGLLLGPLFLILVVVLGSLSR